MAIKKYDDLELGDKLYYLHILHPQDIKALLLYIHSHIIWTLDRDERIKELDQLHADGARWQDVLDTMAILIDADFDELISNPFLFVHNFSRGQQQFFVLQCLTNYQAICKSTVFKKALAYFFNW